MQIYAVVIECDCIVCTSLYCFADSEGAVVGYHVVPVIAGAVGTGEGGAAEWVFIEACTGVELGECSGAVDGRVGVGVV